MLSSLVQPQFSMAMLFGIIGISILLVGSPFVFAFKQDALKQMTSEVGKGLEFRESFRRFVSERKLFHPFFLRYILMCLYLNLNVCTVYIYINHMYYIYIVQIYSSTSDTFSPHPLLKLEKDPFWLGILPANQLR